MCGIVGIIGGEKGTNVVPELIRGLERLEYRGYDSAGIAVIGNGIERIRSVGKVANLRGKITDAMVGDLGIGHTRWATHGKVTEDNAHPIMSKDVAIIHNGIIENFKSLRFILQTEGYVFESETDTEVILHLLQRELLKGSSPRQAMSNVFKMLDGTFAVVAMFLHFSDTLLAMRHKSSLIVGLGKESMYVGSDAGALSDSCEEVVYMEDGDIVEMHRTDGIVFFNTELEEIKRRRHGVTSALVNIEKGEYPHFMLKEIKDQPNAIRNTILHNGIDKTLLDGISNILILACGTSYHAGMVAKYWFEKYLKIPSIVEIASEFRYRSPVIQEHTLVFSISQSGETLDTLAAIEYVRSNSNCSTIAVANVKNSATARASDIVFYTQAGVEMGVASTKAFTAQLIILASISFCHNDFLMDKLKEIPTLCEDALDLAPEVEKIAHIISKSNNAIYLGRGMMYPIALEGALKLKEISYIHAEGFAAGEMKHGPIALIDDQVPVIFLCPSGELFEKTLSNIQEVLARGKNVIVITDSNGEMAFPPDVAKIVLPTIQAEFAPILYSIPLQLIAYYAAVQRGTDIDRPRNLAKSVTVE
ncbi:MAG: glutamine--fructose-6-phosphate transaminase (isomerizing) [Holosporaceae bacterium]|nr:glutamine--fructose-6-phosphate transaminase (isomerizing) [Holosporaceae bacterium]